jgi:hypothetical protein
LAQGKQKALARFTLTAMKKLILAFSKGSLWGHDSVFRKEMTGMSLAICDWYLRMLSLCKEHKETFLNDVVTMEAHSTEQSFSALCHRCQQV